MLRLFLETLLAFFLAIPRSVGQVLKAIPDIFKAMDATDWLGVIIVTVLILGAIEGLTHRDMYAGVPVLREMIVLVESFIRDLR